MCSRHCPISVLVISKIYSCIILVQLDILIKELKRYDVSVAVIQVFKWFGMDVWTAERYTYLHSGRPLCTEDERRMRNEFEGVGITLDAKATAAWKEAREFWRVVSSRIVTAKVLLQRQDK